MKRKLKRKKVEINPEDTLLDDENIPGFNTHRFEGVFERPITQRIIRRVGLIFILLGCLVVFQLGKLQIVEGNNNYQKSEANRLHSVPIFSQRGVIFDRNNVELAWNSVSETDSPFNNREYINKEGFSFLGYIRYPKKDNRGFFWQFSVEGKEGVEKMLDKKLAGTQGKKLVETNAHMETLSERLTTPPRNGDNINLSIDANLQHALYTAIKEHANNEGYEGGAGVIMDIYTGELISLVTYPEYSPQIMTDNTDQEQINQYLKSTATPFLNRASSGLYTPGSVIKPIVGLAALDLGKINQSTSIFSSGQIEVKNPYDPDNPSIFRDWRKEGHGFTNIEWALADSVNTFFYAISGGYKHIDGIGIKNIHKYARYFGLSEKTGLELGLDPNGVIPNPEWKRKVFNDSWRLGDTYITSIGQFGFQVTPLQITRYMAAIANNGTVLNPKLIKDDSKEIKSIVPIDPELFSIIKSGLRQTITKGTAQIANVKQVEVAAKTGTAQVGKNNSFINSWVTGFFPYENPRYAFTIVMEKGPVEDALSASWVLRDTLDWMSIFAGEYFGKPKLTPEEFDNTIQETKQKIATFKLLRPNANKVDWHVSGLKLANDIIPNSIEIEETTENTTEDTPEIIDQSAQ